MPVSNQNPRPQASQEKDKKMTRRKEKIPLLTPGPVTTSKKVAQARARPILFHRFDDFCSLYMRTSSKLAKVFGASSAHQVLILSGSGTLANEAVFSSVFGPKDRILVLANGDFGERMIKILEIHNIGCIPFCHPWATPLNLKAVEEKIKDSQVTAVAMVAMETSTGMVNPVREIGKMCKAAKRIFFVDAISALGAEDINVKRDGINICTSVPNKGIGGPPGLGLVCLHRSILDRSKNFPRKSIYMDLHRYSEYADKNQAPTTPAVSLITALEVALDELLTEGILNRRKRYQEFSSLVRKESTRQGIKLLLARSTDSSSAVTTLSFPSQVKVADLHQFLLDHGVVTWHPSHPGPLASKNILQVSVMGDVRRKDIRYFFQLLKEYFERK